MDKKKKMKIAKRLMVCTLLALAFPLCAQEVNEISFCGHKISDDSITLYLKFLDNKGEKYMPSSLEKLIITEDGSEISREHTKIHQVTTGKRIPEDYTFSVLVDLSIPEEGKEEIKKAVEKLMDKAPDSCVYLSFFGDKVTSSRLITKDNLDDFDFMKSTPIKYFYGAVYAKLSEFSFFEAKDEDKVHKENNYKKNEFIFSRANNSIDKNYLIIFSSNYPEEDEFFDYDKVTEYQRNSGPEIIRPKVYAFYYTKDGNLDENVKLTFRGITENSKIPVQYQGKYLPSDNLDEVLKGFEEMVNDAAYDFEYEYKPTRSYYDDVKYLAYWGEGNKMGEATYSIGFKEKATTFQNESDSKNWLRYPIALLVTALTIAFFFFVIKILVPAVKSKTFAAKYYKKYVPEANVQRRLCHYCRQEILPGERVVTRCRHIMHVHCWKQNDYKCAEYGQNCKDGIQEHIKWRELFSSGSLRDLYLTIWGICAGLVSWIVYDLLGGKGFVGLAKGIANTFLGEVQREENIINGLYTNKISAFLIMGLLLGFFLSLVLRYNDGVRKNDWKSLLKTFGLSLLSGVIGMAAFALGGIIFCWIASIPGVSPNAWYASFPAYLLFSICLSLSLIIKSSIPFKSALLGGIGSAIIGFLVLYFTKFTRSGWTNMLLNFIIYGGGLGASLVTVRMLAEKYFLVIKNGVKAGQRIPIHKWMNATGGGNKVTIGMTERCEIQMTWEKSNKVAKEHVQLYVDHQRSQAMLRPLAAGVVFNARTELPVGKPIPLTNNDTFTVGDTIFQYVEN